MQARERAYLAWIFQTKSMRSYAIDRAALNEYVRVYSAPGALRTGFAWYRANFNAEGLAQAKARRPAARDASAGARRNGRRRRRVARDGRFPASMRRPARSAKAADIFYPRSAPTNLPQPSSPSGRRRAEEHALQIVHRYMAASARRLAWYVLASMPKLPLPKAAICSKPPVIIRFFRK